MSNKTNNDVGHENSLAEDKTLPTSVNDSIDSLQIHGKNGVGFNSILLWVDTQRQIHPADVWIPAALKGFTPKEITDAKNSLWRINNGRNLPKLISREGGSKSLNELKDICSGFNSLSESNEIPIFICTSNMVAQIPIFSSNDTFSDDDRLKAIETSLANVYINLIPRLLKTDLMIQRLSILLIQTKIKVKKNYRTIQYLKTRRLQTL